MKKPPGDPVGQQRRSVHSEVAPRGESPVVEAMLESILQVIAHLLKVDRGAIVLVAVEPGDPAFQNTPGVEVGPVADPVLSVPVAVDGEIRGVLNVAAREDGAPFGDQDVATLRLLVPHVGLCLENRLLHESVRTLANTDGLTELFNYRYFHERLDAEIHRAERFGEPLSVLMIDVDGFKEFNDTNGHPAGDAVLWQIARLLRKTVRSFDVVCRYGGDEFAIILPETSSLQALGVAGRIECQVAEHRFRLPAGSRPMPITLSIGCSSYPEHGRARDQLISLADRALYAAKRMPSRPRISAVCGSNGG